MKTVLLASPNPHGCPQSTTTARQAKEKLKCQIKKRRSPFLRSRNRQSSPISQYNRNQWSRSHSPKFRSRSRTNTINRRRSTLRVRWIWNW